MKPQITLLCGLKRSSECAISLKTSNFYKNLLTEIGYTPHLFFVPDELIEFASSLPKNTDIVFNGLHGAYGETGHVQSFLDYMQIPYTHSSASASAIADDKWLCSTIARSLGITIPDRINLAHLSMQEIESCLPNTPFFLKKRCGSGSSIHVELCTPESFQDIISLIPLKELQTFFIEQCITGLELTCAVYDSQPLTLTSIEYPEHKFFDYTAKYSGKSLYTTPAKIPQDIFQTCMDYASAIHNSIGCSGITRSDFIFNLQEGKVYFLELNTLPGFTETSLCPMQLDYCKIDKKTVVQRLIDTATFYNAA